MQMFGSSSSDGGGSGSDSGLLSDGIMTLVSCLPSLESPLTFAPWRPEVQGEGSESLRSYHSWTIILTLVSQH